MGAGEPSFGRLDNAETVVDRVGTTDAGVSTCRGLYHGRYLWLRKFAFG